MIEWIKDVFGYGKERSMRLDLKKEIVVPEKRLDKLLIKKLVLVSMGKEARPAAEIHCIPYNSVDDSFVQGQYKTIIIEDALEHPVLGKCVKYMIDSLQECINDEPFVEEKT